MTYLIFLFCNLISNGQSSSSSTTLVELNEEIRFLWDNSKSIIVDDALWRNTKKVYPNNKKDLVLMIKNDEPIDVTVCHVNGKITKGQMAFILIDQMEEIPYASVFRNQYCVVYMDCPYIDGLIESIKHNQEAGSQLMEFLIAGENESKKK